MAEFAAPHETTTTSAEYVSRSPPRSTSTPVTVLPEASVFSFTASAPVSSVTFGVLQRRPYREDLGVGLGVDQAGKAVAGGAAHA